LKLRGSWRAKAREKDGGEPVLPVKAPSCPKWLGAIARKEWKRVAKLLVGCRVLTEADLGSMILYAEAFAEFQQAVGDISKAPTLAAAIAAGLTNRKDRAATRMLQAGAQLGLSPAARTRVKAIPEPKVEGVMSRKRNQDAG